MYLKVIHIMMFISQNVHKVHKQVTLDQPQRSKDDDEEL